MNLNRRVLTIISLAGGLLVLAAWMVGVKAWYIGLSGPWRVADFLFMLFFISFGFLGIALLIRGVVSRSDAWRWALVTLIIAGTGLLTQEYARAYGVKTRTQSWVENDFQKYQSAAAEARLQLLSSKETELNFDSPAPFNRISTSRKEDGTVSILFFTYLRAGGYRYEENGSVPANDVWPARQQLTTNWFAF